MGSIVVKEADHLIPDDFLTAALKKYKHGGMIVCSDGNLATVARNTPYTKLDEALEEINSVQTKMKDTSIVLYFTNYPDNMPADSAQPYILVYDSSEVDGQTKIDPMIIGFIDGDMDDDLEAAGSNNTREYFAANRVATSLNKIYDNVGNDLEHLLDQMDPEKNPDVKRSMVKDIFDGEGVVAFYAASGDVLTYSHKITGKEFEWGWASDACGFDETETKLPAGVVSAAKGIISAGTKGVLSTIKGQVVSSTSAITTSAKPQQEPDMVWARPPKHIIDGSKNKKKSWYDHRIAIVPTNWAECPAIPMERATALKEGCKIVDAPKALPPGVHAVPEKKEEPEAQPIIPDAQANYIRNDFLKDAKVAKTLDSSSLSIPNPADMEKEMSKYPTFCEKAGLPGLESTFRWSYDSMLKLAKNAPDAMAVLLMNYKFAYINQLAEKPSGVDKTAAAAPASQPATQADPKNFIPPKRTKRG